MPIIKRDDKGLYVTIAGWIARPATTSSYPEGTVVDGHHFRGTSKVGVGKLLAERGAYREYWRTDCLAPK